MIRLENDLKTIWRLEVKKDNGRFFYTGTVQDLKSGLIEINTIRNETLQFRKEQIMMRTLVKRFGEDLNGRGESSKNL